MESRSRRTKKQLRLNIKYILILVVSLILIIVVSVSASNGGYKSLIKNYCKSIVSMDYEKYKSLFPPFYVDNGLEDLILFSYDTGDAYMQHLYDDYVEQYGEKVKLSSKITTRTKLSKDELTTYSQEATAVCTDGTEINLKKGYNLTVSIKYKGKSNTETKELSVVVVKYDGNWYIYSGDIYYCN